MKFLKNVSAENFLEGNWEKKYLHIPSAVELCGDEINQDELFEMITDEYFETRLIETDINGRIITTEGPIGREKLSHLEKKWIFMIHNFNLYNQFALELEKKVEFIPKWLFDDVMCSFSSEGSTINAHIDKYNVFILQISGKRQWKIQENPDPTYKEGQELRVLKNFTPTKEFTLNPGDMLYIPPHVAHEGYSLEESVSLSIGFKSLEDKDLIENFLIHTLENLNTDDFFKTKFHESSKEDPYLLKQEISHSVQEKVLSYLRDEKKFSNWFGKYLGQGKKLPELNDNPLTKEEFYKKLSSQAFCFDEYIRMCSVKSGKNFDVYINDIHLNLSSKEYFATKSLVDNKDQEMRYSNDLELTEILYTLHLENLLIFLEN